jgi:hypothetical protein
MKGDIIPDSNHISRCCPQKHIDEEGRIQHTAFLLRTWKNEKMLSVNWLEYVRYDSIEDKIAEIQKIYNKNFTQPPLDFKAKIVILIVAEIRKKVREEIYDERNIEIKHDSDIDSHSGIDYLLKVDNDNRLIAELIADLIHETNSKTYPARQD